MNWSSLFSNLKMRPDDPKRCAMGEVDTVSDVSGMAMKYLWIGRPGSLLLSFSLGPLYFLCRELALSLGVVFQLAKFLRDVGEDVVTRGIRETEYAARLRLACGDAINGILTSMHKRER